MRYSSHFFAKGGLGDLRHALYSQTFDVFFKVRPKTFSIPRVRYCRRVNPTFTMSLSQIAHAPEGNSRDCKLDQSSIALRTRPMTGGGARRNRTDDILLAKQALYQLSYGPSHSV